MVPGGREEPGDRGPLLRIRHPKVFFVLPIARQLYGDAGDVPVVAISTFEVVVLLVGTMFILDANREQTRSVSPSRLVRLFTRKLPISGISAGVIAVSVAMSGLKLLGVPIVARVLVSAVLQVSP